MMAERKKRSTAPKFKYLDLPVDVRLLKARGLVFERLGERDPIICPCCDQNVFMYKRSISKPMAQALVLFYTYDLKHPGQYMHFPSESLKANGKLGQGGDWAKLVWWDLIERDDGLRDDDSDRTGKARITTAGREFVAGTLRVPKYTLSYNKKLCSFVFGQMIDIHDAMKEPFDYRTLYT